MERVLKKLKILKNYIKKKLKQSGRFFVYVLTCCYLFYSVQLLQFSMPTLQLVGQRVIKSK